MIGRLAGTLAIALGCAAASCTGGDDGDADAGGDAAGSEKRDAADALDASKAEGGAMAVFSRSALVFPAIACGGAATDTLALANHGSSILAVSASIAGNGFSVSPAVLRVGPGKSAALTVTATVPSSATAGVPIVGGLTLFTNDPSQNHLDIPLSATPTGATLAIQPESTFAFPPGAIGSPASPRTLRLSNVGNAAATFTFGAPSESQFSLSLDGPDGGPFAVVLQAGESCTATAGFTPANTIALAATSKITPAGAICGASEPSVAFAGQGATGDVTGWPATVDLGPSDCGGAAPANQTFTLTNAGLVDAHITSVSLTGASGFTTNAAVGSTIFAEGLSNIEITGPPVPGNSPLTPITATLTIATDADTSAHVIALTEEPSGAILAFDTSSAPNFGSFGSVELLASATQSFNVLNTGSASATVTLVAASAGGATGASSPFSVSPSAFTIGANGTQADSATFTPLSSSGVTGSISMVALTGFICGALPAPLPLTGSGLGAGPTITPSSLSFSANCGGTAPGPQSFIVRNDGTVDLTWSMSDATGPGAAQYSVSANPPPGLLPPGAFATVNVTAYAIPSPAPKPTPSAFAAQLTITTDVPLDSPHVVPLGETALGDQLSFSTQSPLRFGQVPIDTTLPQAFTISNNANVGSSAATVSFAVAGTGSSGYPTPAPLANLAPGAAESDEITFFPTSNAVYPATLVATTTDALCAPLPTLQLSGTGTQGTISVSATTLAFGTDMGDASGLVNCGASGPSHTIAVSNLGNQAAQITGLVLGQGAASPYSLSGSGTALPATLPIGGSATITVTPSPIPQNVANPNDPTPFSDTLTITTDAALDSPHTLSLVMQARGAIIANTPLATTWPFGTVSFGSIGTFTSSIRNTGNAGVSVAFGGLMEPSIFGIESNPTIAFADSVTSIVGQFIPPSSDGSWSDSGILSVTPEQVLCEPLPSQWNLPTIQVSGTSNSNPAVTVSGTLIFPGTDCGSAAPAGQAVSLTNATNVAYAYETSFNVGQYYTVSSPASGTLAGNGTTTLVVTPVTVVPGVGVTPGSAPYADQLLVTVATSPPTLLSVPISWTLDGAVLSLPSGAGTRLDQAGAHYYPADSTDGYLLPMANTGTSSATVDFAIAPVGSFSFSPAGSIQIIPGIGATPVLVGLDLDPVCPAVTIGTATFFYSGPVCQPFPLSQVKIEACFGTF